MKRSQVVAMVLTAMVAACGGGPGGSGNGGSRDGPGAEGQDTPRVFFVAPREGEMISVDLPVVFEFGAEHLTIGPAGGEDTPAGQDAGHYHLGVDTSCVADGETIPRADPWIDLDDGANTLEMYFEPREYSFTVQIGDDAHRALPGLCETISMTVEDGV